MSPAALVGMLWVFLGSTVLREACPAQLLCLHSAPSAYGTLTVRSLLDTREHCLNEFSFPDPYSKVSPLAWVGQEQRAKCHPILPGSCRFASSLSQHLSAGRTRQV